MNGVVVSLVAILAIIQLVVQPGQAITCGQVDEFLAPCIPYLTGGGEPSGACCSGVKAVQGMAQTTADKRACCSCVKAAANRYSNLKDDAAQTLPKKCGVSMDIPISRRVNCEM
ncbi:Non-specific lipid-transfer protein 11 [Forsythia ovata]|uniref:Non-specific lipid-transfer protein n=1 Tax=Forsythia ovata TaxID=205694 RepID=A0ABD1QNT1_9LAMI